jgi:hypothetical protein
MIWNGIGNENMDLLRGIKYYSTNSTHHLPENSCLHMKELGVAMPAALQ